MTEWIGFLRRSWAILVASTLLCTAGGAAFVLTRTPVYEATSQVFVSATSAVSLSDLSQGSTFTQQVVKSYAEVVSAPIVLDRVIKELGLHMTAEQLGAEVRADAPLDTVIVEITVDDTSPVRAANIADAASAALSDVAVELTPGTKDASSSIKVTRIRAASLPTKPISPQIPLTMGLAVLLGIAVGLVVIAIRERLDVKIRGVADLASLTDVPVIGSSVERRRGASRQLSHYPTGHPYVEAYKALLTKLRFMNGGKGVHSIVVSSSITSEGKTTTAASLGQAFAQGPRSVVVVDADLRRPALADYFGVDATLGLSDLLTNALSVDDVLQRVGESDLYVIPAGVLPPNPSELLGTPQMADLIRELEDRFDLVIFDSPPVLPVTDPAVLAHQTGGLLLVSAVGKVGRPEVRDALLELTRVAVNVLGIVVNMLPEASTSMSGYGYSASSMSSDGGLRGERKQSRRATALS